MSASPSQFFSQLKIRQFLTLSGYTLLTYDYLLTFDLEVEYVWHAPWTTVKFLFLLNRYGTLIGQSLLMLEELGLLSHRSRMFCAHFQWFQSVLVLFSSETTRTLLLLRARALWKCSYRVTILLVFAFGFYVVAAGGYTTYIISKFSSYFVFLYLNETGVCDVFAVATKVWLLGFISIVIDTVMFAVIAFCLYRLCRGSQLWRSPLVLLLMRDAFLFYLVNVAHDVTGILAQSVLVEGPLYYLQIAFTFPLLVVTGQRAFLNLRGFRANSYWTPRGVSRSVDRQIAAMQDRSFWKSVDVWMSDMHGEIESGSDGTGTTTGTGLQTTEESYELEIVGGPTPRSMSVRAAHGSCAVHANDPLGPRHQCESTSQV